jgi:uncharacterized membrane protein
MGLIDNLLPTSILILATVLFLILLSWAARRADWRRLLSDEALQHSLFGAALVLGLLWHLRAGLAPGLTIHLFGMTAVTLMLGWELAVFAGLLALTSVVITGQETIRLFTFNALITVFVPALVSHGIMVWERRRGFRNFFAYIFFCGFFGAGIAVLTAGGLMVSMLWLSGVYEWEFLIHDYLRYLPLILIPVGFVNGAVVTGLMVFHPDRLLTLDQSRYN